MTDPSRERLGSLAPVPRPRPSLRSRLATAAAVMAVAAVLVMHGGLDARALASHLTVATDVTHQRGGHEATASPAIHAVGHVAGIEAGSTAVAAHHGAPHGVGASPREASATADRTTTVPRSTEVAPVDLARASVPAAPDHGAHEHALGHVLVACAAVLLAVGALVALVALGRHLRRGVLLPWSSTASPATWLDRLVPVPPPRVALCVERC